jgi:hypothetical protein
MPHVHLRRATSLYRFGEFGEHRPELSGSTAPVQSIVANPPGPKTSTSARFGSPTRPTMIATAAP